MRRNPKRSRTTGRIWEYGTALRENKKKNGKSFLMVMYSQEMAIQLMGREPKVPIDAAFLFASPFFLKEPWEEIRKINHESN